MDYEKQHASVLVVDDNEMNVELLENMLERYNYEVYTALDGYRALQLIEENEPDIVLLDINMPQMNGFEVCRQIKQREASADIPVIFISALDQINDVVKAFEVGGVDYIQKPFKSREVLARVKTHITLARQKREIDALRKREHQQFEQVDKLRSQFIGSATHDLKNPLFIISGYADMLQATPAVQKSQNALNYVASIHRSVDKMMTLVHDMLDLMQLETTINLEKSPVSLNALLKTIAYDMSFTATEKQIKLRLHLPDDNVELMIDYDRMTRVFENLLSNAIKYTPSGGTVTISCLLGHKNAIIEVIDTGLGIPKDVLPNIYQPFQRINSDEHLAESGTGLGLSIVKAIVEQHGGTVTAESELGKGSCFRVTLPL